MPSASNVDLDAADSFTATDTTKRALLPSELKKLQKSKRAVRKEDKTTPTQPSCFSTLAKENSNQTRVPLKRISENVLPLLPSVPIPASGTATTGIPAISMPVAGNVVSKPAPKPTWSLLSKVTMNTGDPLLCTWKPYLGRTHLEIDCPQTFRLLFESLFHYRYPFTDVSNYESRAKISKIILSTPSTNSKKTSSFECDHFKKISEGWKRSLLFLYNSFTKGLSQYFYYLHPELSVCFIHEIDGSMKALVSKAPLSLQKIFTKEGISFEISGEALASEPVAGEELLQPEVTPLVDGQEVTEPNLTDEEDDRENVDPRLIKAAINNRLNTVRNSISLRRSTHVASLIIEGETNIHCLIDYLLNQKDGKAFVVLPELLSPTPFLGGTLCKNDVSLIGPLKDGSCQLKISGSVTPTTVDILLRSMYITDDPHFEISFESDVRTEALQSFSIKSQ